MVNIKHDTGSYENYGYQREISDGNSLYDAFLTAKKGSDWKPQVQHFEMTYLLSLSKMQRELNEKTYRFLPGTNFVIHERGKTRFICGEQFPDRIVKHSLCDEVLTPSLKKYLIYDNGASQKDKGIDFTRQRLLTHLHRYYQQHGSNDGYILLIDFSKYYDNIRHDVLMELFEKYVSDDTALWLLREILNRSKVDVSYMTDEEYRTCLNGVFNSLEYEKLDRELFTGEKFMEKHLNIGDQVAQIAGIIYPIPIDNYVKIVKGVPFYARYSDDSYVINENKAFLEDLLSDIISIADSIGITVNVNKTRICKLSDYWRFLQVQYSLTDTGRIIQKINPKRLTAMRRKMKKLYKIMTPLEFNDFYHSWFDSRYKLMSKQQRQNMNTLFEQLKEEQKNVFDQTSKRDCLGKPRTEREQLYLGNRSRRQHFCRQSRNGGNL
jgi:hypothetical protein